MELNLNSLKLKVESESIVKLNEALKTAVQKYKHKTMDTNKEYKTVGGEEAKIEQEIPPVTFKVGTFDEPFISGNKLGSYDALGTSWDNEQKVSPWGDLEPKWMAYPNVEFQKSSCGDPTCKLCNYECPVDYEYNSSKSSFGKYPSYMPYLPLEGKSKLPVAKYTSLKEEKSMKKTDKIDTIKSAKAKSVYELATEPSPGMWGKSPTVNPYQAIARENLKLYPTLNAEREELEKFIKSYQPFARPCPLNPVHGFVDSRQVKTYNQFLSLVDEVNQKKGDDILEILLMPIIDAKYSAIVTPRSITIGEGNDGATAGKRSIVINTPHSIVDSIVRSNVSKKFTKKDEVPFIELVHGKLKKVNEYDATWVVQVRSGNQPDSLGADYIPKNVTVKRVYEVTDQTDLLEWKTKVENFTKGDVIYAESMSCHGAVHGVANKIPVITSHVPEIGEKLEAGFIAPANYERVATLLKYLLRSKDTVEYDRILYGWKLTHTLAVNNMAGGEEVIAYALYNLIMGGLAACLGEYRHARGKKLKGFEKKKGRDGIFNYTFANKRRGFSVIHKVMQAFLSPRFSSGFGGKPWAECAKYTIELQRRVVEVINNPSEEAVNKAIISANELAHAQHNGGILFNKFGSTNENIHALPATSGVVEKLLELSRVEKATVSQVLLKTMAKPTPLAIKLLWDKWEISKAKQELAEKKLLEKQKIAQIKYQAKLVKEQAKMEKLKAKYGELTTETKLNLPSTKFQIRILNEEVEKPMFRLQIKMLGHLTECDVYVIGGKVALTGTKKKSWYGSSSAKYVTVKPTQVVKNRKGLYEINFKLTDGTEFATEPFALY